MTETYPSTSLEDATAALRGLRDTAYAQGKLDGVRAEKNRIAKVARELLKSEESLTRGVGQALMTIADIEAFEETASILSDPGTMAAIREGEREYPEPGAVRREHLTRLACKRAQERRRERESRPKGDDAA